MLRNGVPILKSLEVSRDAAGNRVLSEAIGQSLGEYFRRPVAGRSRWRPPVISP